MLKNSKNCPEITKFLAASPPGGGLGLRSHATQILLDSVPNVRTCYKISEQQTKQKTEYLITESYKPPEPENSNERSDLITVPLLFNKYVGEGIRGLNSHRNRSRNRSSSNSVQKSKLPSQTTSEESVSGMEKVEQR